MSLESNAGEGLGEDVCGIDDPGGVCDEKRLCFDMGADEVIADVDVFGLAVIGVIDREGFSPIVICRDDKQQWAGKLKLVQ
jgi:hypothetical protein